MALGIVKGEADQTVMAAVSRGHAGDRRVGSTHHLHGSTVNDADSVGPWSHGSWIGRRSTLSGTSHAILASTALT